MPRRDDLTSVLVLGSGPIVIGQACEFDYSGTQACKVLKEEGLRVVLVNSNPATIMTDPELVDATYIEPLTVAAVTKVLEREQVDADAADARGPDGPQPGGGTLRGRGLRPTRGRRCWARTCRPSRPPRTGSCSRRPWPRSAWSRPARPTSTASTTRMSAAGEYGFPVVLRPSFTLGGKGGGIAHDADELREMARQGLHDSPVHRVLVEESVLGWKEYELEVMRDAADNCVVVCSIENVDPMGVHTGDSVTVAPAMTLSDPEYQQLRDASFAVLRRIGVETGGSNVQFAIDPGDRAPDRDRDESPGVAVLGPGLQGDRLPDRQDRRQTGARATPSTRFPTTSRARRWRPSNPASTTW